MIDLHCHSHYSDGHLSPAALFQKAMEAGLRCLSLTDHDTIAGYEELLEASKNSTIKIIHGIEFSARWKKHDVHVLGYQITHCKTLLDAIEKQNQSRITRAIEIGAALERFGVADAYEKACNIAGHKRVGRPHFAQVLVNEGLARDMQTAFKRCLGRGKPAFVPTPWLELGEAIETISQSQGVAVLAHPFAYGLTRTKMNELIKDFVDAGGVGLEVVSGDVTKEQIVQLVGLSNRYKLLASSGSDYHGDNVSRISLGRQMPLPEMCTPIWSDWNI